MKPRTLIQNYRRREWLKRLGLGSAALLLGPGRIVAILEPMTTHAAAAPEPRCVVRPEQTEGPYFIDGKLDRSDLRIDPSDNSVSRGVPLELQFRVSRLASSACAPLRDAIVDVWHCDAFGVYSDVYDPRFDTRGKKFLRGFQRTDAGGTANFVTIYPGWYPGRAVHIHYKIRSGHHEFTSQLYFDETVNGRVLRQAPYNRKGGRRTLNDADFLFRRGGRELLLTPSETAGKYRARFDIALETP